MADEGKNSRNSEIKEFVNLRCPMCGRFISKNGLLFLGKTRNWILINTANPQERKSRPFGMRGLASGGEEILKCYRAGIIRLIAVAAEQGVIGPGCLESIAAALRKAGP